MSRWTFEKQEQNALGPQLAISDVVPLKFNGSTDIATVNRTLVFSTRPERPTNATVLLSVLLTHFIKVRVSLLLAVNVIFCLTSAGYRLYLCFILVSDHQTKWVATHHAIPWMELRRHPVNAWVDVAPPGIAENLTVNVPAVKFNHNRLDTRQVKNNHNRNQPSSE